MPLLKGADVLANVTSMGFAGAARYYHELAECARRLAYTLESVARIQAEGVTVDAAIQNAVKARAQAVLASEPDPGNYVGG